LDRVGLGLYAPQVQSLGGTFDTLRYLKESDLTAMKIAPLQARKILENISALYQSENGASCPNTASFSPSLLSKSAPKPSGPTDFSVFVKTLTGKTLTIPVNNSSTVRDLKNSIWDMEGIPSDQQRIIFSGKQLEDERTMREYGVMPEASLFLVLMLRGGMYHQTSGRQDLESVPPPSVAGGEAEEENVEERDDDHVREDHPIHPLTDERHAGETHTTTTSSSAAPPKKGFAAVFSKIKSKLFKSRRPSELDSQENSAEDPTHSDEDAHSGEDHTYEKKKKKKKNSGRRASKRVSARF